MRIIISGGGTGGHIYPAITIIKAIQKKVSSAQVLFVGTESGLEADIIPKEGFNFTTIEVSGFDRSRSWKNIATVFKTAGGVWRSAQIIKNFKPDIVIGTGGYVCGPVLLAASLMGIPAMIQEQNVIPGITNKILARFVRKIAVGYAEAANYFPDSAKVIFTGNPIREDVIAASRQAGIAGLGLAADKRTVLISGGSRGARSINQAMLTVHQHFAGRKDIQLLHVTGQNEYNDIVKAFGNNKQHGIDGANGGNIIIKPYLYNMPQALAAADLAIFRAGAIGLAELTARGIPAILVPYPYAAANHQEFNADVMAHSGAAVVIRDAELNGNKLFAIIEEFLNDPLKLKNMADASKKLGRPQAAEEIARIALALVK